MTGGIRERARGYLDRFVDEPTWDAYSPDAEQALVDLILSERAAALGAAGDVVTTCRRCGCSLIASGLPHCEDRCSEEDVEPEPLDHAIRSISPEGWRGVREADLAVVKEAAGRWAGIMDDQDAPRLADSIRAALARMP